MAMLGVVAGYFYATGPGKLSVWKELLDELDVRGGEHILDIGCGRGAVLISAAHRLPQGRATGVDIWRLRDQTGNTRAAAEHNAMVEGVSERVDLVNRDARDLPFPAESFDVVLSSLTFNNIHGNEERSKALREAARVLRSGGQMCIVDDRVDLYASILQSAGCVDVKARDLDWRTSFGLPGHHLTLVTANKPALGPRTRACHQTPGAGRRLTGFEHSPITFRADLATSHAAPEIRPSSAFMPHSPRSEGPEGVRT